MELTHLKHAIAVADAGHIGRAAQSLGIAQPALSQSLQRLERQVGVRLFERGRHGARLTPPGAAFIAEARIALAASERALELAQAAADPDAPVRIGFNSTALWSALPGLVTAARNMPLSFHQMDTDHQIAALVAGRLDIGLVSPPFAVPSRMAIHDLPSEPLIAALPARDSVPARISLADMAPALILFPAVQGPALHAAIIDAFSARGLTPRIVQEAGQMPTILALVAAGVGTALVPRAAAQRFPVSGVAFRPVVARTQLPRWPLALAHMPLVAKSATAALLARWRKGA